jgi:tetratricopeptide (TPR) repeat protein
LAGQQALARSAFHEALGYAARGLELIRSLSESPSRAERELGLQLVLCGALYYRRPASEDLGKALVHARDLSLLTGSKEAGLSAFVSLAQFHMMRGELQRAAEMGREAVEMAQATKFLRLAHAGLGRTLLHTGEFQESIENLERALALPESQSLGLVGDSYRFHYASQSGLLNFLSNALWFRGFPDQAMRQSREALRLARESRNLPLLGLVLVFAADFFIRRGEKDRARECMETFAAVAAEVEPSPVAPRLIEIRKGWLLAEGGEFQEGIGTIRNGIAGLFATGCKYHDSFHRVLLARSYMHANQIDNAFASLDDALRFVEQSEERYYEAEIHRLRGELLLAGGRGSDEEAIQGCFRKAIEVARKQDAKSWELRATMSLARLLNKQRRRDEARTMLADIYGWFTEGFDTADLKDAKSLLDELSG